MLITHHYKDLLQIFVDDPKAPVNNFHLGSYYEDSGQTAAAISFFLRSAEFSTDTFVSYTSLLHVAFCLEKQGCRVFATKGILLRAISLLPQRPEAYFFLSRLYERNKDWQEAYTVAELGLTFADFDKQPILSAKEYPGKYGLIFQKAVVAWWIGLFDESMHLLRSIKKHYSVDALHHVAIENNLKQLGNSGHPPTPYNSSMHHALRYKFYGSHKLQHNCSQCFQDIFVLAMLNGKQNGSYVEIGSGDPFYGSNTALLEKSFGWKGVSIDLDTAAVERFKQTRSNPSIAADATKVDYASLFKSNGLLNTIDYLQIDCDPSTTSYNILQKIPFSDFTFAVITFEHDAYSDGDHVRDASRKLLASHGYKLVVGDVAPERYCNFEDWWVHPNLVDSHIMGIMTCSADGTKKAEDYILGNV